MTRNGRRGERQAGNSKRPRQAARRAPARQHGRRRGPGDLIEATRQSLATGEPLDFLVYVSTLLAALDPRAKNPFERTRQQDAVTVPALVESFAEVVLPETTALLAALAELGPDELSRARARRA
jgi:hypothetical protein